MNANDLDIKQLSDGIAVRVRVQPKASRNEIAGILGNSLKVCLTSPPVDGEANKACILFFAKTFLIPKNKVSITNGAKDRNKIVKLTGVEKMNFLQTLQALSAKVD